MKLGFVTAILDSWNYEEMMDFASEQGFECVEVACWPQEKAERRYAGVSHIDAERVNQDDAYAEHIVEYAKKSGVEISSLAYYPNVMAADKAKSAAAVEHLKQVILASKKLGVGMVTTFIGRDQTKNVQENLPRNCSDSANGYRSSSEYGSPSPDFPVRFLPGSRRFLFRT